MQTVECMGVSMFVGRRQIGGFSLRTYQIYIQYSICDENARGGGGRENAI